MTKSNKNSMDELNQELVKELKKITLILRKAFKEQLELSQDDLKADPVTKEILERLAVKRDTSMNLKKNIARKIGTSEKTVERRLVELVEQGILIQTKFGKTFVYESLGIL